MGVQKYTLFLCALFVWQYGLGKGRVVELTDEQSDILMTNELVDLIIDSTNSLSLPEVLNRDVSELSGHELFCRDPNLTYWVRFRLHAGLINNRKWVLEVLDSRLAEVTLFQLKADRSFDSLTLGRAVSFARRPYQHKNFVFDITDPKRVDAVYVLRYRPGLVGSLLFKVHSNQDFTNYAVSEYYLLGIYYGILFIISVYNLFLFVLIKERIYLYYVLYAFVWAFLSMLDDGTGFQYYWTNNDSINQLGFLIARPLLIILFVLYSRIFLDLKTHHRFVEKTLGVLCILFLVYHLMRHYIPNDYLGSLLFIAPFLVVYVIAIKRLRSGFQPAKFFLIGNSFVLLGILIRLAKDAGVINFLTENGSLQIAAVYSRDIGMVIEIVVLSIALGARIRFLKDQEAAAKDEAYTQLQEKENLAQRINSELEAKVLERTATLQTKQEELQQLNEKLKEQANEINQMNLVLDLDNRKLAENVKRVNEARIQSEKVSLEEFKQIYPDELAVLRYLAQMKWRYTYSCKKCGNNKYCEGSKKFSRRCTKCRYDESVTTDTLFHKCKFSLVNALYITMKVNQQGGDVSALELSRELEMRKSTVWGFKQKVQEVIGRMEKTNKTYSEENRLNRIILKVD